MCGGEKCSGGMASAAAASAAASEASEAIKKVSTINLDEFYRFGTCGNDKSSLLRGKYFSSLKIETKQLSF
jgi:hypothetical protein